MARRGYSQKDQDALKAYHKTAAQKQKEKKRQQERVEQARKSAQRVQTANANKYRRSTDTNKNSGKRTVYYRSKDDPSKTVTKPVKPQTAKQQKSLAYRSKDDAKPVTGKQWNTLKNAKPKTGLQVKQEAARKYERQTGQTYKPRTMQELVTGERIWKPDKRAENRARAEGDAARRMGGDFPLPTTKKKQQGPSTWDMVNRLYDEDEANRIDSAMAQFNDPESDLGHKYNAAATAFNTVSVGRDGKLYHHGDQPVTQEMINDLIPFGTDDEETRKVFESFGFTVKPYDLTKSEAENNIEKSWMRANWSSYDDHGRADDGADQMRMMRNSYAWQKAKERGDTDEMERLHQENERIRAKYGYSGGEDGSEYLRGKTTLAETFDRSSVADAELSNARRRLENATTEDEKKAAQQEIDYILSNPNYKGDAGRRFDLLNKSAYHGAVGGTMQYIQAQRQQANYAATENAWKYWEQEANKVQELQEKLKTLTPNTAEYNKVEQEIRRGEAAAEEMRKLKADPDSPFFDYRTAMDHPEIIQPIYDPKWGNMVRQGQREMEEATEGMGEFGKGASEFYVNAVEMLPTLIASLIPGVGPVSSAIRAVAGAATLGQMSFAAGGQRYVDLVDQGVPLRQAATDAVAAQNIELLTEIAPFHMMGRIVTGASPLARSAALTWAGTSGVEALEEGVAGGLNYAWGHGARGYEFDTWTPQDAAKEMLFGGLMGGIHSGFALAVNRGISYMATAGDRKGIQFVNDRLTSADEIVSRVQNLKELLTQGEVTEDEYYRQQIRAVNDLTEVLAQVQDYMEANEAEMSEENKARFNALNDRLGLAEAIVDNAPSVAGYRNLRGQGIMTPNTLTRQETPSIVQTADQVKEEEQKVSPTERIQTEAEEAIKAGAQVIQQQQAQEEAAELMDDSGTPAESMASRYQKAAEAAREGQEAAPKGQAEQTTTQTAQNTKTAPSNDLVERYANTMSENGKAAIRAATEGLEGQERSQMAYNFTDTYLKALTGNRTVKPENMTQAQYDAAVQAGVRDKAVRDQQFRGFDATVRKGKVAHSAADVKLLGTDSLKVMRAAADAFGVPVVVVNQSRIAGGENVPEGLTLNGEYRNGVIYLNRDALKKNAKPEDLSRFVLGHELTHRLQEVATDEYNKLYEYVMSMPEYRDRVMRVARIRGATSNAVDMAGAADEVVADYVGQLVADSAELQRFITEFREEKGLLQKILDFLCELASRLVGKHNANLDRSIRLLEDALKAGSEYVQNAQNAQNAPESGKNGTKSAQNARRSGTVVQNQDLAEQAKRLRDARRELAEQERRTAEMRREIERGDGRHSITTSGEGAGFDVIENKETHMVEFWSDGVKVDYVTPDMLDERGMIGALIKLARDEAGTITPAQARGQMQGFADLLNLILSSQDSEMVWAMAGSALFSAVKANSDKQYKTTIDFGTICVKTQNMIDAMTETMAELGRGLTKDEIMEIQHDIITERGTVPCPVCYVFSRWAGVGGLLDNMKRYHYKYLDMTHEQVEQEIKKLSAAQTTEVKEAARNDPDFGPRYRELEDMVKTSEDPDVVKQAKKELKEYEKAVKRRAMIAADEVYANLASEEETTAAKLERVREELSELNRTAKSRRENAMAIDLRRKSRDKFNERIKDLRKAMKEIENAGGPELSWLKRVRVKPDYFEKGVFTDADGNILDGKDLDAILFNLNAADEWASNAPLLWEFRKSRGAGLGKAILPYSDYRFGDLILGDKENSATGKRTFAEVGKTLNKFQMNKYREAVKRTLAQNWMGGQRFQSTSDFRYDYALDYIQAFLELQALGGAMQTYTKVIEFADMVARIGGDVNMSVMPFGRGYDANGKLVFSSVTGMDAGEAWRLRKRTNNAQLILVGINDEHIRIAMEESDASGEIVVDFIIPYHPSGAKIDTFIAQLVTNLEKEFDTSYYQNYEPVQNDVERDDATTEQLHRAALRQQLLTGTQKVGKKSVPWTPSEADMKLINRRSKNIRDRSFEELYDIEDRALRGDKAAIKEYVSWSAGVLGNIYKAFWSEKSIYAQHGVHLTNEQAGQIMPNEYWDQKTTRDNAYINGFIFRSWCYSLGLHPRFTGWSSKGKIGHGDFSKQKGYWKVLIDRRMYDMNGKFRPQRPINITAMTTKEGLADLTPPAEDDPRYQVQTNRGEEGAGERAAKRFVDRKREEEAAKLQQDGMPARWSVVEDPELLERLENEETITVYRAMQLIDPETGKPTTDIEKGILLPPMAARTADEPGKGKKRKFVAEQKKGIWYQSDEMPHLIPEFKTVTDKKTGEKRVQGYFLLDKGDGSSPLNVAYNPYFHTSASPLNDQFTSAYKRPNLVVVEAEIPKSELTSGYRAEYAKDTVGETKWHSGVVASKLKGDKARRVFLSRWSKVKRVVPDAEAAQIIAKTLEGEDIAIPQNVVTPSLYKELKKLGVRTEAMPSKGRQSYTTDTDEEYMNAVERGDMETAQRMVDQAARKAGYNVTGYHGTDAQFNEFKFGDLGYHIGTEAQAKDRLAQAGQRSTQKDRKDRIMRLYARIRNPLTAAFDFGDWHGKNTAGMLLETEKFEEGYDENAEEINARLEEIARMAEGPYTDKVLREYLQSLGYDGVEYENQFEGVDRGEYGWDDVYEMSYIAFESNQLKLADPVTYDDDGNVIPLSERFSPAKNDVRWSVTEDVANDYLDAIERGDLDEAGRIFDEEFSDIIDDVVSDYVAEEIESARVVERDSDYRLREKGEGSSLALPALAGSGVNVFGNTAAYTDDRIDYIIRNYGGTGNYAQGYVTYIDPRDFLKLTLPSQSLANWVGALSRGERLDEFFPFDEDKLRSEVQTPFLEIKKNGKVIGHEGRHRMLALANAGVGRVPVVLVDMSTKTSKEPTDWLCLSAQDFGGGPLNSRHTVEVENLIPTNRQYRDQIRDAYGSDAAAVRFSISESDTDALEQARLLRENQNLRDRLEFWQGQVKQTERTRAEPSEVRKFARQLMRENQISQADLDLDELTADLQELYDGVGKDWTYEQARQAARSIAENVVYSMDWTEDLEDTEATILGLFHGMPIYLNESVRSNIPDYEIWRRRNLGRLRIVHSAKKGIPVDVFYEEVLRADMPWIFPEVQGDGQALEQIYDVLRNVDDGKYRTDLSKDRAYMESAINDYAKKIMLQHYEFPAIKKTFADRMNDRLEREKGKTGKAREKIAELREQIRQAEQQARWDDAADELAGQMAQGRAVAKAKRQGEEKVRKAQERVDRLKEELRQAEQQARWDLAAERLASDMAHGREMKKLQDRADRNLERVKARLEAREAQLAHQREKLAETREKGKAKVESVREQARQREKREALKREERKLRGKILRHVRKLSVKLTNPTDTQHVPEQLRLPVAMALASIDTSSKNHKATKRTEAFAKLQAVYLQIVKEAEPVVVDPDLVENIGDIIGFADTPIENLGLDQLQTIWDTVRAIEFSISTYNKALGQARFANIMEPSLAIRDYLSGRKDRGDFRGPLRQFDKLMNFGMLKPYEYFRRLGSGGRMIWRMLRDSDNKNIRIIHQVQKDLKTIMKDAKLNQWNRTTKSFTFGDVTVTLSVSQIMTLYELMKRPKAVEHIMVGGLRPDKVKRGLKERTPAEPWVLTADQISEITDSLSEIPGAVETADRLQQYMEGYLADIGNEASMEVFGYKKFREKFYFPIKVDRNETKSDVKNEAVSGTIAGWGSARPTTPNAKNAVIVGSIFDVFADHAIEMATYASWLGTMENFNRIFNFRYKDEDGSLRGGVKTDLERAMGKNGPAYWKTLRDDLNNGIKITDDNPFQALIGAYKGSAVGANIRVIIQQGTSIARALYTLNPVDLVAGVALTRATKYNRIVKVYSPIAVWKSWGYFEMDVGRKMQGILYNNDSALQRVNSVLMAGAGIMDSITWLQIWNACEMETRRKQKDLTPGSDEFYRFVSDRFEDVIDQSQVVDGVLQRSQIMRSPDNVTKMATSFMAEPTTTYNNFTGAIYDVMHSKGRERGAAMRRAARMAFALGLNVVLVSACASLVDGLRDDDKDEKYWEKFFQAWIGEKEEGTNRVKSFLLDSTLGENLNPATYIPWAKDIVSLMQGFSVSRMDMDTIERTLKEIGRTIDAMNGEGKLTPQNAWLRLSVELARFLGIPAANLKRDIMSVMWTYANQTGNWRLLYAMEKFQFDPTASGNLGEFAKIAFAAREAGDDEAADYIEKDMLAAGVEQKKLDNKLETLAKNKMGENEEYQAAYEQYLDTYTTQLNAYPATANLADDTREKMEKAVDDYAKYKAALEYDESLAGDNSAMVSMKKREDSGVDPIKFKLAQTVTSGVESAYDADDNKIDLSASIKKMQKLKEAGIEFEEPEWAAYEALDIGKTIYTMTPEEFDEAVADLEEKINAPSPFDVYGAEKHDTLKALDEFQKNNHSEYDKATGKEIKGKGRKDNFIAYLSGLEDLTQVEKAEQFAKYYPKSPKNPFA